ncbi:hypothetical protein MKX03_031113 [Papaver bracteatum]|nr:hypothetical protein MKX03_031113 [Papaver bracteatum]
MGVHHKTRFLLIICVTLVLSSITLLPTSRSAITFRNETDRFALLSFKDKITSDPFGALNSWNSSLHHCSWTGITCSLADPTRVTVLNLTAQGLVGSISPRIGNLTFLKGLILSANSFNGEIPQEIGRLFQLQFLDLTDNSLQGEIPKNITSCTELKYFFASVNELEGRIPTQMGSLTKLVMMEISGNYLDGTIPVSLLNISSLARSAKLSSLEFFQVSGNNLSGIVPRQLFNISSFILLSVSGNQLSGTIPPNIGITLPNLEELYLGRNMFSGKLPNSISNISSLSKLDVTQNQFTGDVPPNLGSLQGLVILNLGFNQFGTGEADDLSFFNSLSNCTHLQFLTMPLIIHVNNLTGQLPDSIANLSTTLTVLFVGGNYIFGKIPAGIGNLVSLNRLYMDFNLFSGNIPVWIGKLPNLVLVTMSGNQLSGEIPSNICNSTGLEEINFGDNRLQGRIPPSLGNCRKLRVLNLTRNQLFGPIPKELVGISSLLIVLELSWNSLTGSVPSEIGNLEKITAIDFSHNQLSGQIPSSLEKCIGLENLNLQGNFLEGIIPASLRSLKGIQKIDLSRNRLSGGIPEFLESFISLEYLNLSYNEFEGEVPKQGIFKNISAFSVLGNKKLCGGIPWLNLSSCPRSGSKEQSKVHFPIKRLLLIVFGAVIFVIFLGSILIFFWKKKAIPISDSDTPIDKTLQKISFRELFSATNGFCAENLVGVGSYGSVYKGTLVLSQETSTMVAVKVLDLERRGASKSFMAECEALRSIRHRNLVKIMTSCSSVDHKGNEFKALVFEFMPNGSLEDWLHLTKNNNQLQRSLSSTERLNIATDIACALEYLHHHCQTPLVHCDLKPSNVLLEDEMNAHVGDFGLAKFLGGVIINEESKYHTNSTSVGVRGSVGYAAPEYGMGSEVTTNGDVYSYGIMLLEMFTGKRPTDDMFEDGFNLHSFGNMALVTDRVLQIVDPTILAPLNNQEVTIINCEIEAKMSEALTRILKLGVGCSTNSPGDRMKMVEVVKELQSIKNIYLLDLDM